MIVLHFALQSLQCVIVYQQATDRYDQHALSASFLPGHFSVIGKKDHVIEIYSTNVFRKTDIQQTFVSDVDADLTYLFDLNPKARTLYQWSPFVVIKDLPDEIYIFDPRFYRQGASFLTESAPK